MRWVAVISNEGQAGSAGPEAAGPTVVAPRRRPLNQLLVVAGLSGLALVQPVLELLGENPTALQFRGLEGTRIALFATALVVVPPLVLWLVGRGATAVHAGAGWHVHLATVAVLAAALCLWGLAPSPALADPCKAIPDRGPLPGYLGPGTTFRGPVAYVGDGDSLCVAVGGGPQKWVEVRLADFYAPELHAAGGAQAKASLEQITRGARVACKAQHRSYDRLVAVCRIGGRSVGDLMRSAGVTEGGRGKQRLGRVP